MADNSVFSIEQFLQQRWEPLAARLGERRGALLQSIDDKAALRGFSPGLHVARFANLCMALGPGFETRPENEWALAVLVNDELDPWVKLHQLVAQAVRMLRRRGGDSEALAGRLQDNDQWVLDRFDAPAAPEGARIRRNPPPRLRRSACDLEAAEVRLLDTAFRHEYRLQGGEWLRVAADMPAPVRIDAQHPAPERISVLTQTDGATGPVRVQVRPVYHSRCALGVHPAVVWLGTRGREQWQGEAARAPAWPVTAVAVDDADPHLLLPTPHDITVLLITSCGLRDEGRPLGDIQTQLWAYSAEQSLFKFEREAKLGFALPDPKSSPPAVQPTRIVFERDGQPVPAPTWTRGFDESLRTALAQGLEKLLKAWQPHVQDAALRAELGLLEGKAALTWGWREGSKGLVSPPVMRVAGDLDLNASAELHLTGQVEYAGAKAGLRLRFEGQARLQTHIERLHADVDLLAVMQGAVLRWRWPAQLDYDPVADDSGAVFSEVGPCSGALTGSLGLRPSVTVGTAWEWFVTLSVEPVATRVVVHDPVIGRSESRLALLGSVSVLDWSLV
jgi:hypothetical protein